MWLEKAINSLARVMTSRPSVPARDLLTPGGPSKNVARQELADNHVNEVSIRLDAEAHRRASELINKATTIKELRKSIHGWSNDGWARNEVEKLIKSRTVDFINEYIDAIKLDSKSTLSFTIDGK